MGWIAITNMSTSQVNIQIGFFVVLGLYLIHRGREDSGGFALMVATMLKVTPALLLVWLLVRGQWKALRGAALGFIVLWSLVALVLGTDEVIDATRGWIDVMVPYARDGVLAEGITGVRSTNQSLAAGIYRFFTDSPADTQIENLRVNVLALSHGTAATLVRVLNVLLLLAAAWVLGGRRVAARSDRFAREAALLMTLMVVISPISWINHHIALILPYAVGLQVFRDEPTGRWSGRKKLFAAASLLTLLGAPCRLLLAFSLPLIGALLLGVLIACSLRPEAPSASA